MRIIDLYAKKNPVVSLEIFPPRPEVPIDDIYSKLDRFSLLKPDFMSVTYRGDGGTEQRTIEISSTIKNKCGLESMAHLICIGQTRRGIDSILDELKRSGLENILALRGDYPQGEKACTQHGDFSYASDLISYISKSDSFCIAAAAYIEGHPECSRISKDLDNLKKKVDSGVDFLITQLFFDNRLYYDFAERTAAMGISCPIVPGIMPVYKADQIKAITAKSGCSIPAKLVLLMDKYIDSPEDLRMAGIEYAASQIRDLEENGVPGVHIYTMNRPVSSRCLMEKARLI